MTQYVLAKNLPTMFPHAGGQLKFYEAGTTNPTAVYSDNSGTAWADDGLGVINITSEGKLGNTLFLDNTKKYKCVAYNSAGVAQNPPYDDITPQVSTDANYARAVLVDADSTKNALKVSISEDVTLARGLHVWAEIDHEANDSTSVTLQVNALTTKAVKRDNGQALKIGDITGAHHFIYSPEYDAFLLTNPKRISSGALSQIPLSAVSGLKVSNNSTDANHDIDIATGSIGDDTESYLLQLGSALTKRIDSTFAVGTGNGGLSSADSLSADTWYGVFLLGKSSDPTDCDVILATTRANALADTVVSAEGFDIVRLIGHARTDSSSDILPFVDGGDGCILWGTPQTVTVSESNPGVLQAVVAPPFSLVEAQIVLEVNGTSTGNYLYQGLLNSEDQATGAGTVNNTAVGATDGSANDFQFSGSSMVKLNASSQLRHEERKFVLSGAGSAAFTLIRINIRSWRKDLSVTDLV